MTPNVHTAVITSPDTALPDMELDLPEGWSAVESPGPVIAAFSDGRFLDRGIDSNVVLTATHLPPGSDLEGWQSAVRVSQLEQLPDFQILDDRRLEGPDGDEVWYLASVLTDPHGTTLLGHHLGRITPHGMAATLTITTLPIVDAAHAQTFDAIARSWRWAGSTPASTTTEDAS